MANGLAGLFIDPAQYQRERDLAFDKDALAIAQLDPFQRAEYNIASGARRLGGGIGGLLGGVDPELERIKETQALLQQQDLTTPEGLLEAAKVLQAQGRTQEALALSAQAQKMGVDASTIAKNLREAAPKLPAELQKSQEVARLRGILRQLEELPEEAQQNPKVVSALNNIKDQLKILDPEEEAPTNIKEAREKAKLDTRIQFLQQKPKRTPEEDAELSSKLLEQGYLVKDDAFSKTTEEISQALFDTKFIKLTPPQRLKVLDEQQRRELERSAKNRITVELKTGETTGAINAVRGELAPTRDLLTTIGKGLTFANLDTPQAGVQLDRLMATISGDKQLSAREIEYITSAGSLVQRSADAVNKMLTGKSSELTKQQKIEVLRAMEKYVGEKYNKNRETLRGAYGPHIPAGQLEFVIGSPYTFSTIDGGAGAANQADPLGIRGRR